MDQLMLQSFRQILMKASGATSTRLHRAESSGAVLGEETLTEMMVLEMLEMLRRGSTGFDIETFTHHQESQNGADLRIWLNLDDAHIGFSIQSKKATLGPQRRTIASSLDHLVGDAKKRQIDILIASSVHALTNPIHLIYQSPSVGRNLGQSGGCFAMSSYRMNQTMSGHARAVDKKDLQNYRTLLFPWEELVAPTVPSGPTVPWMLVPRNSLTRPDIIDRFGALGVSLGSRSYGFGGGAYEYGLARTPWAPSGGGGGNGPDDGPDDRGGDGSEGGGPGGGPDDEGGNGGDGPDGEREEGGPGSEGQASAAEGEVQGHGTAAEIPRGASPDASPPAQNLEGATTPRGDRSSLLYRAAPKRVLHIGESTEVGGYGTPLSVLKQTARIQEMIAHASDPKEPRNRSVTIDLGHRRTGDEE